MAHDPVGQDLQVFRPEPGGVLAEQPFRGVDRGRIDPGPVRARHRPFDNRDLLGADLSGSLRHGQLRPHRRQRRPQHAGAFAEGGGRPDPTGCLCWGKPQQRGEHPFRGAVGQGRRQVPGDHCADHLVVHQRQPVPYPFESVQNLDQPGVVDGVQAAVVHDLDQIIQCDPQLIQGGIDRRRLLGVGQMLPGLHTSVYSNKLSITRISHSDKGPAPNSAVSRSLRWHLVVARAEPLLGA